MRPAHGETAPRNGRDPMRGSTGRGTLLSSSAASRENRGRLQRVRTRRSAAVPGRGSFDGAPGRGPAAGFRCPARIRCGGDDGPFLRGRTASDVEEGQRGAPPWAPPGASEPTCPGAGRAESEVDDPRSGQCAAADPPGPRRVPGRPPRRNGTRAAGEKGPGRPRCWVSGGRATRPMTSGRRSWRRRWRGNTAPGSPPGPAHPESPIQRHPRAGAGGCSSGWRGHGGYGRWRPGSGSG